MAERRPPPPAPRIVVPASRLIRRRRRRRPPRASATSVRRSFVREPSPHAPATGQRLNADNEDESASHAIVSPTRCAENAPVRRQEAENDFR